MINNIDTEFGKITYEIKDDKVSIIEYSGRDLLVVIPKEIDGCIVNRIKKKAFLSQKFVQKIVLPESIDYIEDYSFARCRKLHTIYIPYKSINIGQDILKDCSELSYICNSIDYSENGSDKNDISFLLAKTLNELNAFFLFDLQNAGTDEWLHHLDATINMRLDKDEMEDFSKMILCGEEEVVCGEDGTIEDSNPEHYKSNRVKEKVRISFLRLLHDYKIDEKLKNKLIDYLYNHTKGQKTCETWQVVLNEHGDEKEYYDFLIKINCINKDNFPDILKDMGNRHTEIKSYLIKWNDENNSDGDLFSEFEL